MIASINYEGDYYLIKPNQRLMDVLSNFESPLKGLFFTGSVLWWEQGETGLSTLGQAEHQIMMKYLFLARITDSYYNSDNIVVRNIVRKLLGHPPIAMETFDQWWEIFRFPVAIDGTKIPKHISKETYTLLRITDNPYINEWIKKISS
jgi:hypothetical protein